MPSGDPSPLAEAGSPHRLSRVGGDAADRRARLVAAALEVFGERGYLATRISDITGRAGVAVGSFYTYFGSKEELFEAVLSTLPVPFDPTDTTGLSRRVSVLDELRNMNRRYLQGFRQRATMWATTEEAALAGPELRLALHRRRAAVTAAIARQIDHWTKAGAASPRVTSDVAAFGLEAMNEQCALQWYVLLDEPPDINDAVEALSQLWARTLRVADVSRSDPR